MGSGAVQVGAETAEHHQVRRGKWFHSKVFQRRYAPLGRCRRRWLVRPMFPEPNPTCLVVEHPLSTSRRASPPPRQANCRCPPPRKSSTPLSTTRAQPYCCPVCPVHG